MHIFSSSGHPHLTDLACLKAYKQAYVGADAALLQSCWCAFHTSSQWKNLQDVKVSAKVPPCPFPQSATPHKAKETLSKYHWRRKKKMEKVLTQLHHPILHDYQLAMSFLSIPLLQAPVYGDKDAYRILDAWEDIAEEEDAQQHLLAVYMNGTLSQQVFVLHIHSLWCTPKVRTHYAG